MRALVLIADPDPGRRQELERTLRSAGHAVVACRSLPELLSRARNELPAACLLEVGLSGLGAAVPQLLGLSARPRIVVLGEPPTPLPQRVRAMPRPVDAAALTALVAEVLGERARELELASIRETRANQLESRLLGGSAAAQRLRLALERVAGTDTPLLLVGESGSRKRSLAELVHHRSPRAGHPFTAASCDLGDSALEGLLFGLPEGDPRSSPRRPDVARGPGLFDRSAGGTLYLGDVADLSPGMQRRLLEVLESLVWAPPGGSPRTLEVRFVGGTSHDLEQDAARGRFSSDLLYRLNVLTLRVPPLRERLADLPDLSRAYLFRRLPARIARRVLESAPLGDLSQQLWPGNMAELETVLERAALTARGAALPTEGASEDFFEGRRALRDVEEALIKKVLAEEGGNRSRAARVLGINRTTLYNKLRAYGLESPV